MDSRTTQAGTLSAPVRRQHERVWLNRGDTRTPAVVLFASDRAATVRYPTSATGGRGSAVDTVQLDLLTSRDDMVPLIDDEGQMES